jgi:OOP family OmpA-OmpF porin
MKLKSAVQGLLAISMVFSLSACIFCNKQPKVAAPPPPPKEEVVQPAPEPAKVVEAPQPSPVMEKESMTLLVEFDTNKANIKPKYDKELARVADFMKKYPTVTTTIEGHTDNVGKMKSNMKLSRRRAESVRNYLVKHFGVEPSRLRAEGYGPTKPIADNKTAAGRLKNRRTVAVFETMVKK